MVDSPIYLRVYTNKLPDLTVLDLPGITRNAVEGQPEDIEEIINTMIESHIAGTLHLDQLHGGDERRRSNV